MEEKKALRVVGYARTSTLLQSDSIEIQEKTIKDYCLKNGLELLRIYTDFGKSGKSTEQRTNFNKMMQSAQKKEFDAILFTRLDRFARSLQDMLNSFSLLEKAGVEIICISNKIDTSTAQGKLLFQVMGAFAEFERKMIQERFEVGRKVAQLKGKKMGRKLKGLPKEEIIKYYKVNKLSIRSLAKLYNVSPATMCYRLRSWNVFADDNENAFSNQSVMHTNYNPEQNEQGNNAHN